MERRLAVAVAMGVPQWPSSLSLSLSRHRMLRSATIADCEPIAKAVWSIWQQFKVRQLPSRMHRYASSEALAEEVRQDLGHWFVCEPSGFFSIVPIGEDKTYKRMRFPQCAVRVAHFACLLPGETLLGQLQSLAKHLAEQSILLVIPSSLREAHWAAVKTGFRELGDSSLIVGGDTWLYLDREDRHDEIQAKLRRAKIVA
jgi:hypothetical protein